MQLQLKFELILIYNKAAMDNENISIFSNSSHLEWRADLSDTILKGTHPRTIPARFGLIWFRGFRGEYLNVKVYDVRRTDERQTPSDGKSSHGLCPGELKTNKTTNMVFSQIGILKFHFSSDFITFFVCILYRFAFSQIIQDDLEFQILGTI